MIRVVLHEIIFETYRKGHEQAIILRLVGGFVDSPCIVHPQPKWPSAINSAASSPQSGTLPWLR